MNGARDRLREALVAARQFVADSRQVALECATVDGIIESADAYSRAWIEEHDALLTQIDAALVANG
jgi:hypothetical protein